ncbi:ATP-dependent permease MDL2, mitochondrial [Candida viswanathii]|uniref:ATP-dependent permease MDL2, mitochondrial n=1 Tax=Candida viswanathii TaxID=5486 RepID=A0A367YG73_9ASCO|nr:ATP-dependent permease MDL2, mitochondrial [Candida viswanathii]
MLPITSLRHSLLQLTRSSNTLATAKLLTRGLKTTTTNNSPLRLHAFTPHSTTGLLRLLITLQCHHLRSYSTTPTLPEESGKELTPAQVPVKTHLQATRLKKKELKQEKLEELEKEQDKKTFRENLKTIARIAKLGKPDWKLFVIAVGLIFCAVLYPTVAVKLVGAVLDSFNNDVKNADGQLMVWGYDLTTLFELMVPFMAVSAFCFWSRLWVLKLLGERLVARLRAKTMKSLLRHDQEFFDNDKHKVGDLISRLSSDAYIVSRSITSNLPDGLKNLLFGIMSAYMMYLIKPILFGVLMLISPPITLGSVWYGEKIRKLSTNLQNAAAGLTKVSEETLNAIRLVNAFTGEQKELRKYSSRLRRVVGVARQEAFAQSNYAVSIYSLYHIGYLSCVALGVYLMTKGTMSAGDVVAFTMYLEFFNSALYSLTTTYLEVMKGAGAGVKLFALIDYKNKVPPVQGEKISSLHPLLVKNDIEFKDVTFAYPTRPNHIIFNQCSFKIQGGTSTCIVAPSGAGKSTVASLLLRAYNIQLGEILIGGKDIRDFQVRELRRYIVGIVQQEPVLLSGTILENIVYGLTPSDVSKLTMQDIIDVSKQANCHDFITGFPDGYDTIIGNRGASLSGGQKQRIAIARALIKRPRVLILDEATSALDSKSEGLINETLKNLTNEGSMTIISIAHRLSTISKSQFVVVLGKHGQVVETGKFVELFSDPDSELSKLLDESAASQEQKLEEDDEQDREADEEDLTEEEIQHLNREAEEIEHEQVVFSKAKHLIETLPNELKHQLINDIRLEEQEQQEQPQEEEQQQAKEKASQ